ncbi:MAG: efflux RND transporter periplasmic adaptor subunit [Planctomycetaceae bacterium]|nr:efflux RND transporter periplasmic adaptor subunit [Planctomycetaceae bacterium]
MTRLAILPVGAAVCSLLALLSGCGQSSSEGVVRADPKSNAAVPRVAAGSPKRETLRLSTTQPGKIEAFEETPLYAKVSGYVDEITVDIGDRVEKGQVLVRISVPELLDEREQKKALRDQADAEVKQSEATAKAVAASLATAQAKVREAEATVARADADYARWKSEHTRISELAGGGSVTRKLVDEALNSFRAAEAGQKEAAARIDSAKAAVQEAEANIDKAKSDVVAAQARLRVAEANLARTETLVSFTEIKAPFDGCVTLRHVDTGHYVQPAGGGTAKSLLVVARTDRVRVFVDVPESDAQHVDKNDAATVTVQALRGASIQGSVARTSWSLDTSNRSLRVEIDFDNDQSRLRPGMYATAQIILDEHAEVLTVPATAIVRDGDSTSVCLVHEGKVKRKPVRLGMKQGDRIEVMEGLSPDDVIVLTGAGSLQDGQSVAIADPAAK